MELTLIAEALQLKGYAVLETGLSSARIAELRQATLAAIAQEDAWRGTAEHVDHGRLLCAALHGGPFLELLDLPLWDSVASFLLSPNWIVHVYSSSCFQPNRSTFSHRIHRDCHIDSGNKIMILGALIALDDFTSKTGLTHFLPGSHHQSIAPTPAFFHQHIEKIALKAGEVLLFDARVWHAAGPNSGFDWRCALALGFSDYYLKQRLDIPRMIPPPLANTLSENQQRRLGYFHQPPISYSEYYDENLYRRKNMKN